MAIDYHNIEAVAKSNDRHPTMNVFYFCSDAYSGVAATSMVSLLENNRTIDDVKFYIADDGISEKAKVSLKELAQSYGSEICFIYLPDPSELLDFPFEDRYQIGHSYPRMCISSLLPANVERVLCLDSDTLVLDDLGEFWNQDMGGNILAGVADCMNLEAYKWQFELTKQDLYCNAGMYLVDLSEWRSAGIEGRIKSTIRRRNGNIFFFEQTLMNYCCRGKIKKLHPRYNVYTLFYAFEYENLLIWRKPQNFYTKAEAEEAKEDPAIVHFTRNFYLGSHPWVENCEHPLAGLYANYMLKTPWNTLLYDKHGLSDNVKHKFFHALPQTLVCRVASFLYNDVRPRMKWLNE